MSDTFRGLLLKLTQSRECYCYEIVSGPKCLPCRAKAMINATQPWEDEREALRSALAKCLKLIEDLEDKVPVTTLTAFPDCASKSKAAITARNLLEGFVPHGNAMRPLVRRFAEEMERKLRKNDHKDGQFGDEQEIIERIYREMCEISQSIREGCVARVSECADAGNFLAILAGYMRSEWPGVNDR